MSNQVSVSNRFKAQHVIQVGAIGNPLNYGRNETLKMDPEAEKRHSELGNSKFMMIGNSVGNTVGNTAKTSFKNNPPLSYNSVNSDILGEKVKFANKN